MGQGESSRCTRKPLPPPDTQSLQRQNYIHRLNIQKTKSASFSFAPTSHEEAPDQFETKGSKFASFNGSEARYATGPSEPSFRKLTAQEESEGSSTDEESESGSEMMSTPTEMQMKYLDLKRQDDFRVSYLRKLSYEKVWVPPAQRPPKHQSVIIFDWDDTLLCTSFLNQREGRPLSLNAQRELRAIEKTAKQLLEKSIRLGRTFIITNAMEGWVEYSAAKYVPNLLPVLQKVNIISARSRYEGLYPHDISKWKVKAFLDVQRQMDSQVITNLNSLGDAEYEMDATQVMGKEFEKALVKTIKFRPNPCPEELLKELELVEQRFEQIVDNARNMKIILERKEQESQ